jgi:hypothetical protein
MTAFLLAPLPTRAQHSSGLIVHPLSNRRRASVDFRSPKRKTLLPAGMLKRGALDLGELVDEEGDIDERNDGEEEKGRRTEEETREQGRENRVRGEKEGRMSDGSDV